MGKWLERMLVSDPRPGLRDDAVVAARFHAERPDLSRLSEAELLARHLSAIYDYYTPVLIKHFLLVYESSIAMGMLNGVLTSLNDVSIGVRLVSGWCGVASAAPAAALWALGRRVAASPALMAAFDVGDENLLERLSQDRDTAAREFLAGFEEFQYEFGSRATSEYEALPKSWETHPAIPLGLVDRLRLQPADHDPGPKMLELAKRRKALAAEVRAKLGDPERQGMFDTAMLAVERYMPARELSKTTMVRILQEARLPLRELARRYVGSGHLERVEDITMLTLDEIKALIEDPAPWAAVVARRWEWWHQLRQIEPPYIINGEIPPVEQWPKKKHSPFPPASAGEVLVGVGACPGTATGMARIVDDPSEAQDLQPGEILVAPETDPGWTPLFLSAVGVVVNAGNQLSHAAIISRELGIPCVLAVVGATKRITNGALVTVDGAAGTVTVH
jgi:phosphohistidine swiveling domain-containing protein